jgi:hypothetical protein
MEGREFYEKLIGSMKLPFNTDDVKSIDVAAGNTVYVTMNNKKVYYIMIEEAEPEFEEEVLNLDDGEDTMYNDELNLE